MKSSQASALVRADALLEAGKPEGELLVVKDALERDPSNAKLKARLKALAAGADVQAYYGREQGTALTLSIFSGHLQATELLLAAGANPNVCAEERTPLARAVFARELALVKTLVAKGADVKWLQQELASGRMTAIKGKWLAELQGALG